jgi:predicted phage-related endonuclease
VISEEQKKNRIGRIGSSDVPLILGISPYGKKSPAKQYRDAYFRVMDLCPKAESSSMRDGNFLEPAILNWAEWKIGRPLLRDMQIVSEQHDWMIASFDGITDDDPDAPAIVEAKWVENPEFQSHWGRSGNTKHENVPDYVLAQIHHQMLVAGPDYRVAYAACLRAVNGFGLYGPLKRDDELIGLIFEAEQKFYTDHILPKRAPELPAEEQTNAA